MVRLVVLLFGLLKMGNSTIVRFPGSNHSELFRVAAPEYAMWSTKCAMGSLEPSSACPVPGSDSQILGFLLAYLKVDYEIIPYYDSESVIWGANLGNGAWTGILGDIANGSLETTSSSWFLTAERLETFAFAYPIRGERYGYILRQEHGNIANSLFLAFKSFTPLVWGGVVAVFVCVSSLLLTGQALSLRAGVENRRRNRRSAFRIFAFYFDHGPYDFRQQFKVRTAQIRLLGWPMFQGFIQGCPR